MHDKHPFLLSLSLISLLLTGCAAQNTMESTASYTYDSSSSAQTSEEIADDSSEDSSNLYDQLEYELKLTYSIYLEIQTLDYDNTLDQIKEQIQNYNGTIQSQSVSDYDTSWYSSNASKNLKNGYMQIRIPSESYEAFIDAVSSSGKLTYQSVDQNNITQSYYDTSIVIEALQSEQTKLLELMEQAQDLSDVIAIETRLSEVESQLKQAQTQMAVMDQDIAYSTVNINIAQVSEYQDLEINQFGVRMKNALLNTWTNFIAVMQNICISLVYALPFFIVILILLLLVVWIIHKHKKHKKSKIKKLNTKETKELEDD
jgi:hypothetical protein